MGHGAWESRASRNDPVGHFSEGACLQGRHGARSKEHGAWEGRALRNDPVGHFSEGACLQGRHGGN
jgi:hypothetical protein